MGSVVKKIQKKANKFNKAMEALEKALKDAKSELKPAIFDIKSAVHEEIKQMKDIRRKERNKRKAKKALLNK